MVGGKTPNELGDSWFTAKAIYVAYPPKLQVSRLQITLSPSREIRQIKNDKVINPKEKSPTRS